MGVDDVGDVGERDRCSLLAISIDGNRKAVERLTLHRGAHLRCRDLRSYLIAPDGLESDRPQYVDLVDHPDDRRLPVDRLDDAARSARRHDVSLNADVQFALSSDYAKSFWPYIDSFHRHNWVDEDRLAELIGRDLWGPHETAETRRDFRSKCRKAFDDMKRVSGLREWRVEIRGAGRHKTHRYHYVHGLEPGQMELPLAPAEAA